MFKKAKYILPIVATSTALLGGCSSVPSAPEWITGSNCRHVTDCADGFYPNERGAASRHAKDWYCWDWNTSSSSSQVQRGSEEYERRVAEEVAKGCTPSHWNSNRN